MIYFINAHRLYSVKMNYKFSGKIQIQRENIASRVVQQIFFVLGLDLAVHHNNATVPGIVPKSVCLTTLCARV